MLRAGLRQCFDVAKKRLHKTPFAVFAPPLRSSWEVAVPRNLPYATMALYSILFSHFHRSHTLDSLRSIRSYYHVRDICLIRNLPETFLQLGNALASSPLEWLDYCNFLLFDVLSRTIYLKARLIPRLANNSIRYSAGFHSYFYSLVQSLALVISRCITPGSGINCQFASITSCSEHITRALSSFRCSPRTGSPKHVESTAHFSQVKRFYNVSRP